MDKQEYEAFVKRAGEIRIRCIASFLTFLDYVKVSDANKGGVIPFEKWPALVKLSELARTCRRLVVLKARQVGVSWWLAAYALWIAMFFGEAKGLLLSLGEREAMALLGKCKFVYKHLPVELQFPMVVDSASRIEFVNGSSITALPSTEDAGRSETATLVICDEWDYHEYAEQNFAATKPTVDAGGQFIGVSTPDREHEDSFMKETYRKAKAGLNGFVAHFIDCFARPGRDESWYEQQEREFAGNEIMLLKEYPRTEDEALSPLAKHRVFSPQAIARMRAEASREIRPEHLEGKIAVLAQRPHVHVFQPPVPGWRYAIGVDVGEGIGQDFSVGIVLGNKGMLWTVCAVYHSNQIRTDFFARDMAELGDCYFHPLLGFENNSLGNAVGNKLLELKYPKLFYMDDHAREKGKPGWNTNEQSKETALQDLAGAVGSGLISSSYIPMLDEMSAMRYEQVETSRGPRMKPVVAKGSHDDLLMALSVAYQMAKQARSNVKMPVIKFKGAGTFAKR